MNYYEEIKSRLIDNEINKIAKDYSKNGNDLNTYYNVGKLLVDAGKHYGEGIIKEYFIKLKKDLDKKYSVRYLFAKVHPVDAQLTMSHYKIPFYNKKC